MPWVTRWAMCQRLGHGLETKLRGVAQAHDDHARVQPAPSDLRMFVGGHGLALKARAAATRHHTRMILPGAFGQKRHARKRPAQRPGNAVLRDLVHAGHHGVQVRIHGIQPRRGHAQQLLGRDLFASHQPGQAQAIMASVFFKLHRHPSLFTGLIRCLRQATRRETPVA